MKVLVAHVRYRHFGGEDAVVDREIRLLRNAGVEVTTLVPSSEEFDTLPASTRADIALSSGESRYGRHRMSEALESGCDIVHVHNAYPLLGVGALLEAAKSLPVVQTWHNYRLSCLAGTHVFEGATCTECCVGDWRRGVGRGCYRGSVVQSIWMSRAVKSQMAALNVGVPDRVLCVTQFQRDWYIRQGIEPERLVVKPNSVATGQPREWALRSGVACVGRLSPEKGVLGLVQSWSPDDPHLTIVGDGPLAAEVAKSAREKGNVTLAGSVDPEGVRAILRSVRVLAFPSLCMEGLPLTVLESLSEGTPVVCFERGAVERIESVMSVPWSDFEGLRRRARGVAGMPAQQWQALSTTAVASYSSQYTDVRNTSALLDIYTQVIERRPGGRQ